VAVAGAADQYSWAKDREVGGGGVTHVFKRIFPDDSLAEQGSRFRSKHIFVSLQSSEQLIRRECDYCKLSLLSL